MRDLALNGSLSLIARPNKRYWVASEFDYFVSVVRRGHEG